MISVQICVETMMHLTCTNMPVEKLDDALDNVKSNGIQNILALRGDPPHGQDKFVTIEGGFSCALDLVRFSIATLYSFVIRFCHASAILVVGVFGCSLMWLLPVWCR